MIRGDIAGVVYCLPPGQKIDVPSVIQRDKEVIFHSGIPDFDQFTRGKSYLVILDDLMNDIGNDVMNLFTRQSHHNSISVLFLVQNIFFGGNKSFRTISLNSHYLLCTKNPRDRNQISPLALQLYPENVKFVKEAYADATKDPFSYILFDLSQTCPETLRIRTNVFPDDFPRNIIYVPTRK